MDNDVVCVHTHTGILFSFKKRKSCHFWNVDELGGYYYTEWNKPDGKRQILMVSVIHGVKNKQKSNSLK